MILTQELLDISRDMQLTLALKKRCMGIDYGTKNTGIAVTDTSMNVVASAGTIRTSSLEQLVASINATINKYDVGLLVIGVPDSQLYNADKHLNFADSMRQHTDLPIYMQDEYYTSISAGNMLTEAGFKKGKAASLDDQVAAQIILSNFLDKWRSIEASATDQS